MSSPLVSVIIPTYKRPKELKKAVKSVTGQTYENIEIIVVNDAPQVDVKNILSEKINTNYPLKVIKHEKNKGGAAARNTGIKHSKGKYISFLDDDDVFLPQKIEKQVEVLEELEDEWVGCYCWNIFVEESGRKYVYKSFKEGDLTEDILLINPKLSIQTSSLLLKSKTVKKINGFNEEFRRHQDWEFLIRVFKHGGMKLIKKPLLKKMPGHDPPAEEALENELFFLSEFEEEIKKKGKKMERKIYASHYLYLIPKFLKEKKHQKAFELFTKFLSYGSFFHHPYKYYRILSNLKEGIK